MNSNNIRRLTTILLLVWLPIFVWSQHATVAQIRETAFDFFNHAIDDVNADTSYGPAYDLLVRPVNDTYHGIVIRDGKKYVQ